MTPPNRYNLPEPTEELALASLERALGATEAHRTWSRARQALGFGEDGQALSVDQLRAIAEHLARQPGFIGVMGTSLQIRLDTFAAVTLPGWEEESGSENQSRTGS
jgi:hypothetical protein